MLEGRFSETFRLLCGGDGNTFFGYQASGDVGPSTSPYFPGSFTQQGTVGSFTQRGTVAGAFNASFKITTSTGTTIVGTATGFTLGSCGRSGATSIYSNPSTPGTYEATIRTADGRTFRDAGSARARFYGQAPYKFNGQTTGEREPITGTSFLSFSSQFAVAQPALTLTEAAVPSSGPAPLTVKYSYTLANRTSETLFHVSVAAGCSPVTYESGDVPRDELLQPGETWTFGCTRTYSSAGTFTDQATATGTSSQTGLPATSTTSQTTVTVTAGETPPTTTPPTTTPPTTTPPTTTPPTTTPPTTTPPTTTPPTTTPPTTTPPTDPDCRGLQATIVGTPGDDDITGTPGDDVILGLGGNDRILGLGGDDTICGGGGDDRLVGGSGADRIIGGDGADYIAGDAGADVLVGSAGDDRIRGGADNDKLDGEDECRAGAGTDTVVNCEL